MRVGKLPIYASHASVPTPDISSFGFIYKFSGDGYVYIKLSDGTYSVLSTGASTYNPKIFVGSIAHHAVTPPVTTGVNTLGANIVSNSRIGVGLYQLTFGSAVLTLNKTICTINQFNFTAPATSLEYTAEIYAYSTFSLAIKTYNAGVLDDVLSANFKIVVEP